jgi:hypothetical protein
MNCYLSHMLSLEYVYCNCKIDMFTKLKFLGALTSVIGLYYRLFLTENETDGSGIFWNRFNSWRIHQSQYDELIQVQH